MKSWNLHSWYITGILTFLLIMAISLQWDRIPDLPGVISFALGLSSLLLAIIAIIQSLTGSSDIAAGLSSIRVAADDIKQVASQLTGVGGRVAESSEKLFKKMNDLSPVSDDTPVSADPVKDTKDPLLPSLSLGGSLALYASAWSAETGRPFSMTDVSEDNVAGAYGDGFLRALISYGHIKANTVENRTLVESVGGKSSELRHKIRKREFANDKGLFERSMDRIDRYFSE